MSHENLTGLFIWLSGLHTTARGTLGDQLFTTIRDQGWQAKHYTYSHHKDNQAEEGFTLPHTLVGVAHFIKSWRRQHGNRPVAIGGSGFGGYVATLAATDRDNNINGLVLLNPSLNMISEYLQHTTRSLPWWLRGIVQRAIWVRYAYLQHFWYTITKADGEKPRYFMPQSLIRDMKRYDVMQQVRDARLPIFAATPSIGQEGFLASVELCNAFCDKVYAFHNNWPPIQKRDQNNLGHSGDKLLTADNMDSIRMLLRRAAGHHRQREQQLAELGAKLSAINAD